MRLGRITTIVKKRSSKGMTFIEVLVALFLLVVGVIGAVAMQATVKKSSFDAMQRSLASALAQDIIERIRSNDPNTIGSYVRNDYGAALDAVPANRCNSPANLCNSNDLATNDRFEWESALMGANVTNNGANTGGLIGARACISQNANAVQVVISWQGRVSTSDNADVDGCGTANNQRRQVVVEAFIN